MKKILILAVALIVALPAFAQKMTKEEKAALAKALNETALKAFENKDWAIVPTSYVDSDGVDNQLTDNSIFLAYEPAGMFIQGWVTGGNNTNCLAAEVKEYTSKIDKKGNLTLRIVIQGRQIQGVYKITMKNNGNVADVIFTPSSGTTRKFQGPVVPSKVAGYFKKSNPI